MTKSMLIDSYRSNTKRMVVLADGELDEFDISHAERTTTKGNIYLATISRVEPSLQACFVNFGGDRHGFLPFTEIHPDYYRVPVADRQQLLEQAAPLEGNDDAIIDEDEKPRNGANNKQHYRVQEVINTNQVVLIQVIKEDRGSKGAHVSTYLSLAGRYCILKPNNPRGGGISRKIEEASDRSRIKRIVASLDLPDTMSLIIRTAGESRTALEIKRDYEYLVRCWNRLRDLTLKSRAPALIHEEADLIHRALRDIYEPDFKEIIIDGEDGYKSAREFMRQIMPTHVKKVKLFSAATNLAKAKKTPLKKSEKVSKEEKDKKADKSVIRLFPSYGLETKLAKLFRSNIELPSHGYIVIHQTEALVAIDVNSGRSKRERNIERTALNTNIEAAIEICKQIRLRDLAGLIVIDFIDMEQQRNIRVVENVLRENISLDRARIAYRRMSQFGMIEMSRQRLRSVLSNVYGQVCKNCGGTGVMASSNWLAQLFLNLLEEKILNSNYARLSIKLHPDICLALLNERRDSLVNLETDFNISLKLKMDAESTRDSFKIYCEAKYDHFRNIVEIEPDTILEMSLFEADLDSNRQNHKNINWQKNSRFARSPQTRERSYSRYNSSRERINQRAESSFSDAELSNEFVNSQSNVSADMDENQSKDGEMESKHFYKRSERRPERPHENRPENRHENRHEKRPRRAYSKANKNLDSLDNFDGQNDDFIENEAENEAENARDDNLIQGSVKKKQIRKSSTYKKKGLRDDAKTKHDDLKINILQPSIKSSSKHGYKIDSIEDESRREPREINNIIDAFVDDQAAFSFNQEVAKKAKPPIKRKAMAKSGKLAKLPDDYIGLVSDLDTSKEPALEDKLIKESKTSTIKKAKAKTASKAKKPKIATAKKPAIKAKKTIAKKTTSSGIKKKAPTKKKTKVEKPQTRRVKKSESSSEI